MPLQTTGGKLKTKNGKLACGCCSQCLNACGCIGCGPVTIAGLVATDGTCNCSFYTGIDVLCDFVSRNGTVCTYVGSLSWGDCGTATYTFTFDSSDGTITLSISVGGSTYNFSGTKSEVSCTGDMDYVSGSDGLCDVSAISFHFLV